MGVILLWEMWALKLILVHVCCFLQEILIESRTLDLSIIFREKRERELIIGHRNLHSWEFIRG